jgi:hypothetical protein
MDRIEPEAFQLSVRLTAEDTSATHPSYIEGEKGELIPLLRQFGLRIVWDTSDSHRLILFYSNQ